MTAINDYISATDAPNNRSDEFLDARDLPPPLPLRRTLEQLVELDDTTIFVQLNDRTPQHLYPQLNKRCFRYETFETDDGVITIIWKD